MWAEFGVALRRDPAFKNVEIKKSLRKGIYWVSGIVATDADLDRPLIGDTHPTRPF